MRYSVTRFFAYSGIAGVEVGAVRFLAGVFLDGGVPTDPAPPKLIIPDVGFTSLSPQLGQSFYIGDALAGTGSGAFQNFQIPAGASHLYLGFHDGQGGEPGWYGDNTGSISLDVVLVPEPTSLALLGLGGLLLTRRRR